MAQSKKQAHPPPHYRSLSLRNFRGFKTAKQIPLRPLTFLVGPNSAGKSSLFDTILLVAQSELDRPWAELPKPVWSGELVDLGSYRDTVFAHDTELGIRIALDFVPTDRIRFAGFSIPGVRTSPERRPVELEFHFRQSAAEPSGRISRVTITDSLTRQRMTLRWSRARIPDLSVDVGTSQLTFAKVDIDRPWRMHERVIGELKNYVTARTDLSSAQKTAWRRLLWFLKSPYFSLFLDSTERVTSGRAGPKRWYARAAGPRGRRFRQYGPTVFQQVGPAMIEQSETETPRPAKKGRRRTRLDLSRVLRRLDIASRISRVDLGPYHSAIHLTDNITGVKSNLTDVGYGASQVIPVVMGCLSDSMGPLLVEQPEIHLHPKAQAYVAELLCLTSRRRQVIVETHSEHMINRARLMVAEGRLFSQDVIINYVFRDQSGSHVHTIPILSDGEFGADWPDGFFDERYHDTMALLRVRGANKK